MKEPTIPGTWRLARGKWPVTTPRDGDWFCDDCYGGMQDAIWYFETETACFSRTDPNWIWLCEDCARRRGITW